MENNGQLSCKVSMEWRNKQGCVEKKLTCNNANLRVIRNEFREMFIEMVAPKITSIKLRLKGIVVHNKFMHEGKASINFQEVNCTMFLSNVPPAQLIGFLRMIFVKMTGEGAIDKPASGVSLRTKLLSNKPKEVEEISPMTIADIELAKKKAMSKSTSTTPSPLSRKRKLEQGNENKGKNPKRLYSSPSLNEPLNIEQQEVINACLAGYNIFFTGSAGTGKSYLLRKLIAELAPDVTFATASTGVAACQIGGTTLHQFAGVGSGEASLKRCIELASRPGMVNVWRKCKHLIIDEISMVDADFFEKIEAVGRAIRRNDKPFGGIQLILCGDFLQLPPIIKTNDNKSNNKIKFCFQTAAWDKCIQRYFELKQVHRQNDKEFIDILNSIRIGRITDEIVDKLKATSKKRIEGNGILATRLCSHTNDVNVINETKLSELKGQSKTYDAQDSDKGLTKQLDTQTPVPSKLVLKVGCQVMLLKNINVSEGLVNGARGVVADFQDGLPLVQFRNKKYLVKQERWNVKVSQNATAFRVQVPLKLAWAFSIHKSQGLTLDCVEMSLARVFEAGQAYVALSRAQSLETLRVLDFQAKQVWANPDVLDFYRKLQRQIEQMEIIPLGNKSNVFDRRIAKSNSNASLKSKKNVLSKKMLSAPLLSIS